MNGLADRFKPYGLAFFSSLCIMILELVAGRLVVRHVGASLTVWTSVIGVMLGGICLGNVLGGRLADRVEPAKAVGPLYAIGAALTLACLWINAVAGWVPDPSGWPTFRTIVVVTIDFLIPTTALGMIGPIVAKMAVDRASQTGSAVGNVYFVGAVGSIAGTFLAGFVLIYLAPTTTIVAAVAAALALMAAVVAADRVGMVLGLATAVLLGLGASGPIARSLPPLGLRIGTTPLNLASLAGHVAALALGVQGFARLLRERQPVEDGDAVGSAAAPIEVDDGKTGLADLAALSFVASAAFMALEMVAGRLVTRHLGSSIYGWTSIIGVLLGGLSIGNLIGGRIGNRITKESQASWLFLIASVLVLSILFLETPPKRLVWNPYENWVQGKEGAMILGDSTPILSRAILMKGYDWGFRVLWVVMEVFLLPSIALGTMSPVVAKLAIDRLRVRKRTGAAIGQVYAWGMVGSILGTFLTGFVLIDTLGTKGMVLALATVLAVAATMLGTAWHAAWAGIPLGLCIIAFVPSGWFEKQGLAWGIREPSGDPATVDDANAWIDESDYYYIKIDNEPDAEGNKRTLVLDNLIHGYFILGHPERLDYDYEHIYALVTDRVARAKAKAKGQADLTGVDLKTMFLGGGAYTFPRYLQHTYPGTAADVAEIDPAVTRANHAAMGLPTDTPIKTTWGDARAFVERNQKTKQYDLIFGDAFNDFSVPWHLTTREFNEKLGRMMGPEGVYMINIIDVFESDAKAIEKAKASVKARAAHDALPIEERRKEPAPEVFTEARSIARARSLGGFIGAWTKTAKLTFPHIYVFGTDEVPGSGLRETFVVVASKVPLDLDTLGGRDDDPKFFQHDKLFTPKPYDAKQMEALNLRSHGIILTDDYAPVEDLLAPIARTRGEE